MEITVIPPRSINRISLNAEPDISILGPTNVHLKVRPSDGMPLSSSVPDRDSWFVCHTRPRCEKQFSILMAAEQFEHYLPLVRSVRRYKGGIKRFTKPLFPGYVFARIALERKARIYQRELIARAIPVTDEPTFLRQIESVRVIAAAGYELTTMPLLSKGRRVRVVGGPLHGLEGQVDDAANPHGIIISVDILQQGVLVKLPVEQLRIQN